MYREEYDMEQQTFNELVAAQIEAALAAGDAALAKELATVLAVVVEASATHKQEDGL